MNIMKYLLNIVKHIFTFFYKLYGYLFTVRKIKTPTNNLYYKYFIMRVLFFFTDLFYNIPIIGNFLSCSIYFFIHYLFYFKIYKLIKLEITDGTIIKNLFLENYNLVDAYRDIYFRPFLQNDLVMGNKIVLEINIKNENDKNSIMELVKNYSDRSGKYANTLNNIFEYKKINKNQFVEIHRLINYKKQIETYHMDEIKDKHISFMFN